MKSALSDRMNKGRILGILLLIAICAFSLFLFKNNQKADQEINAVDLQFSEPSVQKDIIFTDFNPNELSKEGWISLGFTSQEAGTILNWKDVLGGAFSSKNQIKKCYAISAEKYAQLEAFIILPEQNQKSFSQKTFQNSFAPPKQLRISGRFNPDVYSNADWQKMGFSERQAEAILKYKNYLGGSFLSKEKFKDCFIISPENYQKLAPYLLLPDTAVERAKNGSSDLSSNQHLTSKKHGTFNPNDLDVNGWRDLGFSEKQAAVIVNYRDRNLRGSFKNLEDVKKCFVISEEKFEELKPFMILTSTVETQNEDAGKTDKIEKSDINFSELDLNEITGSQLTAFGFDQRAVKNILALRKNLGGFAEKNQLYEAYGIDREMAEKLTATVKLNGTDIQKYTLVNAPESWLKTHPYFKYSADKIIFYRISEPDDKKIWKFIKVKPEYEAKMRMYLK